MAGALTRILNNQIYNQTIIASQKIAAGSIVGSLFASNITVPGDLLIAGNLFVLGNSVQTTISSTNTYVNDPLLTLNNGFAGTNTYDEGLVFNRGTSTNQAFIWSEYFKEFRVISTTEAGTTYGNVNATGLANLSVGNFVATGITTINNVIVSTLAVSGNVIGGLAQFAALNSTPIGNATPSSGNFTYAIAGNVLSGFIGNTGTAFTGASLNVSGNVLATQINVTTENASTINAGAVNAVIVGNAGATVQGTTAQFTGNVIGGLAQFAAINSTPIGNATASTGAFTTLSAANNLWANASIATTTQGTGAIVVPNGGISVSGAANVGNTLTVAGATQLNSTLGVGGITSFTNTTNSTSANDGAVIITGGASVGKDLWVGGNLYAANIIGVSANVITVQDPLLYLRPQTVYPYNYDIGIYSAFTGAGLSTLANVYQHTAIFRDPLTNTWTFASNLAEPSASYITVDASTIYDPIKAGNLQLTVTTDSTNATSGALIVAGGAGIGGNIFQTGTRHETSASNFLLATTPTQVDAFKAATTLNIGANSGTLTIGNPTVVGTQTTQNLYNTTATTMNFAGAATTISIGASTGTTTFNSTTTSTNYNSGSVIHAGGVGINGNLNISRNNVLTVGADYISNVVYAENAIQAVTNVNIPGRIAIKNSNTGNAASAEFTVMSSNGSNIANFATFGIAGQNNTLAGLIKPGDTFIYNVNDVAANLVIAGARDTVFVSNAGVTTAARISTGFANVGVQYATAATSATTGAFTVIGGISTQANLWVGTGATFNSSQGSAANNNFTVKGAVDSALFVIDANKTSVVINGQGNATPQAATSAKFGGTGAILVPVGTTAQRPGSTAGNVDVAGMVRFNSTSAALEYYDGSAWNIAGSVFTVISDRQFSGNVAGGFGNVDGTNYTYTIQANATTSSTIVSINGVMQFPVLAYSVSGATLTFTEPPAPGDVIDVRVLTTTSTVASIASGNGYNQFITDATGSSIWTGTSATTERVLVDNVGNFNLLTGNKVTYDQTVINVPTTATATQIDTWSQTVYSSAKYLVQAKVGSGATGKFESYEARVITDGAGNAYITTYGIINNGTTFGTLSANVVGSNVNIYFTSTIAQANVKASGTFIV
jgi:hypothetical protein